jgi:hypothetical protein
MGAVTLFGFYVLALSQLDGAVLHDMHLLWFAAVLAVSPCVGALTLTERGWGPPHARSAAYSLPLAVVRALFAAIYFFPGVWKLRESGLTWALSDNLRNKMYAKWFEWGGRSNRLARRAIQQSALLSRQTRKTVHEVA